MGLSDCLWTRVRQLWLIYPLVGPQQLHQFLVPLGGMRLDVLLAMRLLYLSINFPADLVLYFLCALANNLCLFLKVLDFFLE